ncbi:hypothetical protein ACDI89_25545 (plasmid) [Mycobacteroides abscessus]|uniref:hypothetical protein n=1 Tax=Mycobacteroides abscessus TaxID=36809 RepID=UPI0009A683FE|nr:hypothetical protein [Mycobacteroides abscessus]MBE5408318.1 hypothetical protein [Mycobacteroides abscessus]MBN7468772.1 hypothetical protein [Mycobacteroides abscessus subsp. massiliense]OTR18139.1 hypothetical protein B9M82_02985 [Mycobacteroides abscessus]SLC57160.1 Uncharacterised protein [Mycobacteroides abscessus subsp. massiliense]SLC80711.1 Uncharacterised protein [Mycobacteroides abscessus subsp. massiliense]
MATESNGALKVIGDVLAEHMPDSDAGQRGAIAAQILGALKEASFKIIGRPDPRTAWLYEDGPDPDPAAVAELKRMFEEERAAIAKRSSDPV